MTYTVQFPKLGLKFDVNTVAFQIGDFTIAWYGVLIAIGFLLALFYAVKSCKKMNIDPDKFIDVVIAGIIFGIIGARLYYVVFYPGDLYVNNPLLIFDIGSGGLGIYGGIIFGLGAGALVAKWHKLSVPAVLDVGALGFLIGQCIGRWGNLINQEAFGGETTLPWGMYSTVTSKIVEGNCHPCFLYESLWCLLGFILLHLFTRRLRRYDGQTFLLYMIWYGVGRFFIESLRTDSLYINLYFVELKVSQLVAVATVLTGIILLLVLRRRTVLTGCGSPKIMELNNIDINAQPVDPNDDGMSTIFGDLNEKVITTADVPEAANENAGQTDTPVQQPAEPQEDKKDEEAEKNT